jgi:formamidopyrimidine-DNA glycosylase
LRSLTRRGKYLLFQFEQGGALLAHLGMTGKFVRRPQSHPKEPYSRAHWLLDSGDVVYYRDPRMFGRMEPVASVHAETLPVVQRLGIDPLVDGLDATRLKAALQGTRQAIKVALLDQARIAGLGNLHDAEALFRAHLHPTLPPSALTDADWKRLARSIHQTIAFALRHQEDEEVTYLGDAGEWRNNPFFVYDREGKPCRRCRTPIERIPQAGRSTYFCPHCQPKRPVSRRVPSRRKKSRNHSLLR